jgi:Flp pilus assembly protein TadD
MTGRIQYLLLKYRAITLLVFGQRNLALAVFQEMLDLFPSDTYALASRAHVQRALGKTQEALQDMRRLTEAAPTVAAHWFNYGFMLEELGQYEEAAVAMHRATELDPKLDRAWYGLGLLYIRLGRLDEAVGALKTNTELQPMSPYGWYQLARVHVDRQEPKEATKILRHLNRFEPKVAAQLERETGLRIAPSA